MKFQFLVKAGALAVLSALAFAVWAPNRALLGAPKASSTSDAARFVAQPIPKNRAVIVLGGGCFWSMEAIYKRIKGVDSANPGYAGGTLKRPTYEQVSGGKTGHAEAVQVVYNPKVVSYGELVEVLLTVLDPTTLNQQGADVGPNYRSVIFYGNPNERKIAQETVAKINAKGLWPKPIVTEIAQFKNFTRAEDYHLNYYDTHQSAPYCRAVIVPKLDKLKEKFAAKLK